MGDKDKRLLFRTILFLIVLVNLTLLYGLFSHFVLRNPTVEINWLLSVFAAEVVACTALAWRKVINAEVAPHTASCGTVVIEKPATSADEGETSAALLKMGRGFLDEARDCKRDLKTRKQFARHALELFAQVPKGHPNYYAAVYNSGTAYRILGAFGKARSAYQQAGKVFRGSGPTPTAGEKRVSDANVEMMLGTVYEEEGQLPRAQACYFNSLKLDPGNMVRMLNLHKIAARMGKQEDAHVWASMLSKHPDYSASIERVVEEQSIALAETYEDDDDPEESAGKGL
jgi:tetratricopeptide (TPR) repeat protein